MRTSFFAAALGLSFAGCLVGDPGTTGAGDDDGQGNGSQTGSGSNNSTPKLDVSVDKTALSTELLTSNMVTVTLRGSGGFSGPVTLAGTVVDAAGVEIPGWTVALDKSSVDVAADGIVTAVATLTIPSQKQSLAGTLKIAATSSLGISNVASAVTVANQVTLNMSLNNGLCVHPVVPGSTTSVSQGTKVRWVNNDPDKRITIHVTVPANNALAGFTHQPDPGMAPNGGTYEQIAGSATGQVSWYCHAPGNDAGNAAIIKAVL